MSLKTPNLTTQVTAIPSFPIQELERSFGEKQLVAEDGTLWAYRTRSTKLRRWRLTYPTLVESEYQSLIGFLDARYGGYERFYWDRQQSSEVDIPVVLVPQTLDVEWVTPVVRAVSFEIREVK